MPGWGRLLALVAVMIMVSVATRDWHSIRPSTLRMMPWSETDVDGDDAIDLRRYAVTGQLRRAGR